jgi:23S rRNA (cytidine2498-2'-O)-methyltransferase
VSSEVDPPFLFVTCQVGAEQALKGEMARLWPGFRLAYSRPGFLTFKLPETSLFGEDTELGLVFARSWGFSLGKATAADLNERANQFWQLVGERHYDRLHVWPRDRHAPTVRGYTPGITAEANEAAAAILTRRPEGLHPHLTTANQRALRDELVLDCVLVREDEWWVGYHRARNWLSCWPGGLREIELPAHAVSRAYLKQLDTLDWSNLPLREGQLCAEIGCAPGGAAQALLDRGLHVLGIDPAEIHPSVVEHPHFTWIRKRGAEVRRREFRKVKWLMTDMNVAPSYTLDTVEAIVTHAETEIRGMLLTLKLLEWQLADEIPAYLERIRSWGFERVRAQQLQHHRQEVVVAAQAK